MQRARSQTTPKPLRLGFVHPVQPKDAPPPNYVAFVGPMIAICPVARCNVGEEYHASKWRYVAIKNEADQLFQPEWSKAPILRGLPDRSLLVRAAGRT